MPPAPQRITPSSEVTETSAGIQQAGDSGLSEFDRSVLEKFEMVILNPKATEGTKIPFQFPPKVVADQKQAIFNVTAFPAGWEPIKVYYGSEARVLTVEAEWISTDDPSKGNNYTAENIAQIFRDIRQYYYQATIGVGGAGGGKNSTYPTVRVRAYEIVPTAAFFRLMSFNVAYGPEMASSAEDGQVLPVYAKTTFSLELVTTNTADDETAKQIGKPNRDKDKNRLLKVGPLVPLKLKWF